jgi:hypothetical protein
VARSSAKSATNSDSPLLRWPYPAISISLPLNLCSCRHTRRKTTRKPLFETKSPGVSGHIARGNSRAGALWAKSVTSLPTFPGAQFDTRFAVWNGMALSPYARLSWVHKFKPDRAIDASFIALPAAGFTVDGPRAASDAARIDAGVKLAIGPNAWLFASFDGEFSSRSQSYAGKGGAKATW